MLPFHLCQLTGLDPVVCVCKFTSVPACFIKPTQMISPTPYNDISVTLELSVTAHVSHKDAKQVVKCNPEDLETTENNKTVR